MYFFKRKVRNTFFFNFVTLRELMVVKLVVVVVMTGNSSGCGGCGGVKMS